MLELRMVNLLDPDIIQELKEICKDSLVDLSKDEMTVLTTAYIEEGTNHKRIFNILDLHPADISNLLKRLVDSGFLMSNGIGRGTIYQAKGVSEIAGGVKFYVVEDIPSDVFTNIKHISKSVTEKERASQSVMFETIISICKYGYFSLHC